MDSRLLCSLSLVGLATACDPIPSEVVQTEAGAVQGTLDQQRNVLSFLGVPFAAPTDGDRRFAEPEPPESWDGVREAVAHGDACPQAAATDQPQSEDCLNLDIWAPAADGPHPVMVWIHGGGFIQGTGTADVFDGVNLAQRGQVVVVSINYRLGLLGFLSADGVPANLGIRDQVRALQWVHDNIAGFGGDPDNVTVFGESAGGGSVCALLGVPEADELFHRAIVQSGGGCVLDGPDADYYGTTVAGAQAELVAEAGCGEAEDLLACLREPGRLIALVDVVGSEIVPDSTDDLIRTFPVVDGELIVRNPRERVADGERDVPLIIGTTSQEGQFTAGLSGVSSQQDYEAAVAEFFGEAMVPDLLALYPTDQYLFPATAWETLLGEALITCPSQAMAATAAGGTDPAFTYSLDFGPINPHAIDVLYVFGNAPLFGDAALVRDGMQDAWSSFARDGAPFLHGGWPAHTPGNATIARLDVPPELVADMTDGRCAALESLGVVP